MNSKSVKLKDSLIFKKGNNLMTIIAGIKFDGGIVIASDSQVTRGDELMRTDERKIDEIEVGNIKIIFAGAGDGRLINRAKEQLILECQKREINSSLEFKDVCEDVVNFIKDRYVEDDRCGDEPRYPNLSILIGVFINKELSLLRVYADGVAMDIKQYEVIGSGSIFAEYIFSRFDKKNLSSTEALNAVIYIVEEIKEIDPNCGGPTTISTLFGNGKFFKYKDFDKLMNDRAKMLQEKDDNMKSIWQKIILNPFDIPILDKKQVAIENKQNEKQENNK